MRVDSKDQGGRIEWGREWGRVLRAAVPLKFSSKNTGFLCIFIAKKLLVDRNPVWGLN